MLVCEVGKCAIHSLSFTADGGRLLVVGNSSSEHSAVYDVEPFIGNQEILHIEPWRMYRHEENPDNGIITIPAYDPITIHRVRTHPTDVTQFVVGCRNGWLFVTVEDRDPHIARMDALSLEFIDDTTLFVGYGERYKESPGRVEIWQLSDPLRRKEPHFVEPKGVMDVAVDRSGGLLAWSTGQRRVVVWDPRRQDPIRISLKSTSYHICFHPEGQHLAAAQDRGAVILDIAKRHQTQEMKGHTGRITCLAYRPDGRVLATGSWDQTVRLWEVSTGKFITALSGPTGRIYTLAYDADGLRLAVAGDAGNVVIWDVD